VVIPATGPALSAAGALISDLARSFELTFHTTDTDFEYEAVNVVLAELESRAQAFIDGPGEGAISSSIQFSVEARYPHQVWELECPLRASRIADPAALDQLRHDFHEVHRDVFSIADDASAIEFESWHARATCRLREPVQTTAATIPAEERRRDVYVAGRGLVSVPVWRLDAIPIDQQLIGPAIVETTTTTVMVDDGAGFTRRPTGSLHVVPDPGASAQTKGGGAWTASEWLS
jgi:N-methylhydantoinase A